MPQFSHIYTPSQNTPAPSGGRQGDTMGTSSLYAWWAAMHTRVDIMLLAPQWDEQHLLSVVEQIWHTIAAIEAIGNCFDPLSELSKYNTCTDKESFAMSRELAEILSVSEHLKAKTHGLFNINIAKRHGEDPCLNLSGILKGYALDKVAAQLQAEGITNHLLSLGTSSILAHGNGPEGNGWTIMPDTKGLLVDGKERPRPFVLCDQCLTISGNDTEQRAHIVDPRSGKYVCGHRMTAVITSTATEGEAMSTAAFIDSSAVTCKVVEFYL